MSSPPQATPPATAQRLRALIDQPLVAAVAALPVEYDPLLVGGAVRDQFLDRSARDIDAVVSHGGDAVAEILSARLGVKAIRLGGDRFAAYRLELPEGRLDLWDRHPMSLEDDLRRRDFTINSIAYRLGDHQLLDPFDGRVDLERRVLRATSELSFTDDPLRVVRLARFAVQLPGFDAEPTTIELARASAADLDRVASERIREELRTALAEAGASAGLALLGEIGVYPHLWTGSASVRPSAGAQDRLERLERRADALESRFGPRAVDRFVAFQAAVFDEFPEGGTHLRAFHARGLLSNRELRSIEALLAWRRLPDSTEECRWFLHRMGVLWPAAACYLGSTVAAAEWEALNSSLIDLVRTRSEVIFAPPPLLNGHEISEILALPPGPRLGDIAGRLRRAQVEGRVSTRSAAVDWLERLPKTGG